MTYEVRSWYEGNGCLYTDDVRVKDLAVQSPHLKVTAHYFKGPAERTPFAWDIVGDRDELTAIVSRFSRRTVAASR